MEHKIYKKIVLIILDGFGVAPAGHGNAISQADKPTLDYLVGNYPAMTLQASGPLVGLPWGEMGNSEVGHLNIGAGRIVGQDLPRITNSIQSAEFFKNPVFLEAISHAKKNNSSLHLVGMVSPGGVHSYDEHMYALLSLAGQEGLSRVYVHMFTDGRDTEPKIALETLKKLRIKIEQAEVGEIATIGGRFYTMDRGGHWNQTEMTYNAMVLGQGPFSSTPEECVSQNYSQGITDEMIKPAVMVRADGTPVSTIRPGDAVIYVNFRSDRALQLTQMFTQPQSVPEQFRKQPLDNLYFATMTEYIKDLPVHVAFPPMDLKNNLAEVICNNHMTQFHIAESEKYAHVTVFFNCGRSEKYPGEERVIVTSPDNSSNYSDKPEMSAPELTGILVDKISKSEINFFVANFANCDIVGHTGLLQATVNAAESIDRCLKKIIEAALLADACVMITADHGNAELMINTKTGDIDKDHTTSPVPFLVIANEFKFAKPLDGGYQILSARIPSGVVSDIAPTILELFGLPKPPEMTGINLFSVMDPIK